MNSVVVSLLLVCISLSANAQLQYASSRILEPSKEYESPVRIKDVNRVAYKVSMPPGWRMRNVGRTLTIAGGALLIGGIIVYNNVDQRFYTTYTASGVQYTEMDPTAALGVLMIINGIGMTVPGVILWSKGGKKFKRHLEREGAFNFKGNEVSLSYRF